MSVIGKEGAFDGTERQLGMMREDVRREDLPFRATNSKPSVLSRANSTSKMSIPCPKPWVHVA